MKLKKKAILIFLMLILLSYFGNANEVKANVENFDNFLFVEDSQIHGLKRKLNKLGKNVNVIETDFYNNSDIKSTIGSEAGKVSSNRVSGVLVIFGANEVDSCDEIKSVLGYLLQRYSTKPIYITSILPCSSQYEKDANGTKKKVEEINEAVISWCNKVSNLYYIDVSDGMLDENGYLKLEYSDNAGINLKSNDARNFYMKNLKSSMLLLDNPQNKFTSITGNVLLNPGKGLFYYDKGNVYKNSNGEYTGELSGTDKSVQYEKFRDIIACGYYRFDLGSIYSLSDYNNEIRKAIKKYKGDGKEFAFRIRTTNSTAQDGSNLPSNLFSSNAQEISGIEGKKEVKFINYNINGINRQYFWNAITTMQTIPDWKDENYIKSVNDYLEILQNRLENDINEKGEKGEDNLIDSIAFIEAGFYGNFGEQQINAFGSEPISASELKDLYIDSFKKRFPNTWILNAACDQTTENRYKEMYQNYAKDASNDKNYTKGVGLRCDGMLDTSITEYVGSWASEYAPVAAEFCPVEKEDSGFYYKNDRFNGRSWRDELEDEVKAQKLSYLEFIPVMFFDQSKLNDTKKKENNESMSNTEFWYYLANKLGYYFKIKNITYTKSDENNPLTIGDKINIKFSIENDGVARLYENCDGYIGIFDSQNNFVEKYKIDNIDLNSIESENTEQREFFITLANKMAEGEYKIALGLFKDNKDEDPDYQLANDTKISETNWYEIGKIYFTPDMFLLGDIDRNGKINLIDVFLTYNAYLNADSNSEQTKKLTDINKDGKVDLVDVFLVYNAYIGQYDYGLVKI